MITVRLDDGAVVQFPDGISQQEIATAVAKYYVAAVPIEAAVAAPASEVVDDPDHAPDASHRYETPADTTSDRLIFTPPMRRFTIEQFQNEDYIDRFEMSARLIEELRQRSGAPEPRSVDPPPPDHPFRDNMHAGWSRRVPASVPAPEPAFAPAPPPDPTDERPQAEIWRHISRRSRAEPSRSPIDIYADDRDLDWSR